MRNRTKIMVAAAAVALVGSTAAATAPAAMAAPQKGSQQCVTVKPAPANAQYVADGQIAARLGVSTARFEQAMREVKTSLAASGSTSLQARFDKLLAHALGISQARVRQVFPEVTAKATAIQIKVVGPAGQKTPKPSCTPAPAGKLPAGKVHVPQQSQQQVNAALSAAVAKALHVSTAKVESALQPLFAAGRADPLSPAFATAAQQLGVSVQQLTSALGQAKQSLAPAS